MYPGINFSAYEQTVSLDNPGVYNVISYVPVTRSLFYLAYMKKDRERPTLLSLNRFEKKKNAALALKAFALIQNSLSVSQLDEPLRLVLAGKLFLSS